MRSPLRWLAPLALALLCAAPGAALEITDVEPSEGSAGDLITITGTGFGTGKPPRAFLSQPGQKKGLKLKIVSSDDTTIVGELKKATAGIYDVNLQTKGKNGERAIAEAMFEVKGPEIMSVAPPDPGPGDEVEILGNFFSAKKGKVSIIPAGATKGKNAKVIAWEAQVAPTATATATASLRGAGIAPAPSSRAVIQIPKNLPGGTADLVLSTKVGTSTAVEVFDLPDPPPKGGGGGGNVGDCKVKEDFRPLVEGNVNGQRTFKSNATFWERPFGGAQILVQGCRAPDIECDQVVVINAFYDPDAGPATLSCGSGRVFLSYDEGVLGQSARMYEANPLGGGSCTVDIELDGNKVFGTVSGTLVQSNALPTAQETISLQGCFTSNNELDFKF